MKMNKKDYFLIIKYHFYMLINTINKSLKA